MTKKRITCILLGFAAALSAVFVGVLPQSSTPAKAELVEDYVADMQTKVSALPKNDTKYLYILSNIWDEPKKVDIHFSGQNNPAGSVYHPLYISLFSDLSDLREPLGLNTAQSYADFLTEYENAIDYETAYSAYTAGTGTLERDSIYKLSNIGRSFEKSGGFYLDISATNYSVINSFCNGVEITDSALDCFGLWHRVAPATQVIYNYFIDETLYLYVAYEIPKYLITFSYLDGGGGWVNESELYLQGSTVTVPEVPAAPFATFKSWNKALTTANMDVIYKAVYDYDKFVVSFVDYKGSVLSTSTVTYYDSFPKYSAMSYTVVEDGLRNTYAFDYWVLAGEKVPLNYRVSSDITVEAKYKLAKSVDVSTGEVIVDNTVVKQSFWTKLSIWWKTLGNTEFLGIPIGGFLQILVGLLGVCIGIPIVIAIIRLLIMAVQGIIRLINMIRISVAKRRGR